MAPRFDPSGVFLIGLNDNNTTPLTQKQLGGMKREVARYGGGEYNAARGKGRGDRQGWGCLEGMHYSVKPVHDW